MIGRPLLAVLLALALLVGATGRLHADQGISLDTQVSSPRVAVGEPFRVRLTADSTSSTVPTSPRLQVPAGFTVQGPSVSTQTGIQFSGGQISRSMGLKADWTLVASRPGRYTIGPASVEYGGRRVLDRAFAIEVVAGTPGGARQARPPSNWPFDPGFDPFSLFSGRLPRLPRIDLDPDALDQEDETLPPAPEGYQPSGARDKWAFLDARVQPDHAVVGQQVTLVVYAYASRGRVNLGYTSEASRADFLTHTVLDEPYGQQQYRVRIGDEIWWALKVREFALFPLKTGELTIGPMSAGFEGPGYSSRSRPKGLVRTSQTLAVSVSEPPVSGRPPGYELGDVGQYSLDATVEPRQVPAGAAVSVLATLRGTGNIPSSLLVPERRDVDWLEPAVTDELETRDGKLGGARRFKYVVELRSPGLVDLGELRLPYWDPILRRYETARAVLGTVEVAPSELPASASKKATRDLLSELLVVRPKLGEPAEKPLRPAEHPWYWVLLGAGPLGFALTASTLRLGRHARDRWRRRRNDPGKLPASLLREAHELARHGRADEAIGPVEKALFLGIEQATGLRARGVLRSELVAELGTRGVSEELGRELAEILERCEAARFTAAQPEGPSLVSRAKAALTELRGLRRTGKEAS
ncbi:MAG: BatD family protein [Polyangiaceae bacterium]|nr:BatD family protein [Polyangiaceae bacterium]